VRQEAEVAIESRVRRLLDLSGRWHEAGRAQRRGPRDTSASPEIRSAGLVCVFLAWRQPAPPCARSYLGARSKAWGGQPRRKPAGGGLDSAASTGRPVWRFLSSSIVCREAHDEGGEDKPHGCSAGGWLRLSGMLSSGQGCCSMADRPLRRSKRTATPNCVRTYSADLLASNRPIAGRVCSPLLALWAPTNKVGKVLLPAKIRTVCVDAPKRASTGCRAVGRHQHQAAPPCQVLAALCDRAQGLRPRSAVPDPASRAHNRDAAPVVHAAHQTHPALLCECRYEWHGSDPFAGSVSP